MTDRYAVIGNPVSHSLSPMIHAHFAKQTQQDLLYEKICCDLDKFPEALATFIASGGKGANVTVPFKEQACEFVDTLSPRAQTAQAVNTIIYKDDHYYGDNTDGYGLIADLTNNLKLDLANKDILILGAGGAVKGILPPLFAQQPQTIIIANRSLRKAQHIAKQFLSLDHISAVTYSQLGNQQFDLVINATSASLQNVALPLPDNILAHHASCYDLAYGIKNNLFLKWAKKQGALFTKDGIGMLIEQAAEAFYLWRGIRPNTEALHKQLG